MQNPLSKAPLQARSTRRLQPRRAHPAAHSDGQAMQVDSRSVRTAANAALDVGAGNFLQSARKSPPTSSRRSAVDERAFQGIYFKFTVKNQLDE